MSTFEPITNGALFASTNLNDVVANRYSALFTDLTYLAGAIVLIYLILGGIQYMQAGSDIKKAEAARATIRDAVIGAAIIIGAYTVINIGISLVSTTSGLETAPITLNGTLDASKACLDGDTYDAATGQCVPAVNKCENVRCPDGFTCETKTGKCVSSGI